MMNTFLALRIYRKIGFVGHFFAIYFGYLKKNTVSKALV